MEKGTDHLPKDIICAQVRCHRQAPLENKPILSLDKAYPYLAGVLES